MLAAPIIQTLAHVAEPWRSAYNDSKLLAIVVLFAHLGALLLGGGLAVAADRTVLRLRHAGAEGRHRALEELHTVHRPVIVALVVLFISGVLMAAADVETFATSPAFWVKMALVTLLLINGGVLYLTEESLRRSDAVRGAPSGARDEALWRRLRVTAVASMILWTATVLAGTVLVNAA